MHLADYAAFPTSTTSLVQSADPNTGITVLFTKKAAALLHGIASAHGFNDGNKPTAWLCAEILCLNSGYDLEIHPGDRIDDVVVDVVTGSIPQDELVEWFKARMTKL